MDDERMDDERMDDYERPASRVDLQRVSLWTEISEGFQSTTRLLNRAVTEAFTLDAGEANVLLLLFRSEEGRLAMTHLANEIGFSSGGLTKLGARLAERGLVERASDSKDRRIVYLQLTDDGRTIGNDLCCLISSVVQSTWEDVLTDEQIAGLASAMTVLRKRDPKALLER
ncbi:MarR family winged helix-turn-helix transcriptional regulator [Lacisediminihabitans changchengi]|uniref:MarR family transcriptional regulator n=1 Tax=Lacisediminihabitans changchengi TaxID=2787634 RepID=A0A934SSU3_9MICO|nr:MarR family transcriptional regulator [Lacisediminihabitans changchengi]MBK4348305.1 MarR family transcriptional regulator [Lacisediminihabitans changchengi]